MRTEWKMIGLAIAILLAVGQSVRAEDGRPSQAALEEMGLGGLAVMSDSDGMSVRGHGFKGHGGGSSVEVYGHSSASINTPFGDARSRNGYEAEGKHHASGKNGSWAGVEIKVSHSKPKPGHGGGGGEYGGKPRGGGGWGSGGHGGGKTTVLSVKVFAGGYSSAKAW